MHLFARKCGAAATRGYSRMKAERGNFPFSSFRYSPLLWRLALSIDTLPQFISDHEQGGQGYAYTPCSSAKCALAASAPGSPVHHGTSFFILQVRPRFLSSSSKMRWISGSSSSYSTWRPPSLPLISPPRSTVDSRACQRFAAYLRERPWFITK